MSDNSTKVFPKLQKKIKWFLSEESGKISKKDALWISVGALLLSEVHETLAANPAPWTLTQGGWLTECTASVTATATVSHASGLVNGHYSAVPTANIAFSGGHASHGSHGSHGSHWSHWSHCSGCCCCSNR